MRKWIEYLMGYSPAHEDFIAWIVEVQNNIMKNTIKAAKANNPEKVIQLGMELAVYDSIRERFVAEFRELQSQTNFNQNKE